jgi:hypothetical protein
LDLGYSARNFEECVFSRSGVQIDYKALINEKYVTFSFTGTVEAISDIKCKITTTDKT